MPDALLKYTTLPTPCGVLLVAATSRGLCRVALADSLGPLVDTLNAASPNSPPAVDDHLQPLARRVLDCLEDADAHRRIVLNVAGTAFQWRVWRALQTIPPSQTRCYSDIAAGLGKPTATRAVAAACAANPAAIVIPCHRVTGKRGELRGFRWGIERKRWLLQHETALVRDDAGCSAWCPCSSRVLRLVRFPRSATTFSNL